MNQKQFVSKTLLAVLLVTGAGVASASCKSGGWFDEHRISDPSGKWQGALSLADQDGRGHYHFTQVQRDNGGGQSGRTYDARLSDGKIELDELEANQRWSGTYIVDSDGYVQFDKLSVTKISTGERLWNGDMEGVGCFKKN